MKKITFFLVFALCALVAKAQTGDPIMTMKAEPGKVLDFELTCATAGQTMYIDWGDGVVQQYDSIATADDWSATNPMDTVRGEGNIKIYGDASQLTIFETIWSAPYNEGEVAGSKITAIDLSKVTELTKLTIQSHDLATLDVTALTKLARISILGGTIEEIDLSKNTELTSVTLKEMNLLSVDLSGLSKMTTIYLNDNANLTTANLVMPTEKGVLQSFYVQGTGIDGSVDLREYTALKYVSMPNTQITSLDVRGLNLSSLFVQDCPNLTTVLVDSVKTTFNIRNNNFTPATLPALNVRNYYYDPLLAYAVSALVKPGEAIDLSSQYIVRGDTTTYVWKYNDNTIVDPTLYTEDKGVFTFNSDLDSAVYCEMTIPAYPKLTGEKAYVTTPIMVKNVETIMTMTAEPGKALDFELMCATAGQTLYIDWGDGKRVQYDNIANAIDDWWGTEVGNTVLGEGNIAIYGDAAQFCYFSSIWSAARTEGEEDGSKILSVDVSKATELTDLTLQSHALTTIDVSNLTKLTSLIVMCNLTEIDLSKNPEITTLTLSENDLQSLDLSHLSKLKTLRLNENRGLTNETLKFPTETGVLTSVYALGLGLTGKVDFSMYPKITTLSLNDNPGITGIDARGKVLTSLTCLDCSSLTEILVDSVRTTFNVRNTAMTPATLPYFTIFNFTYDPLLAYAVSALVKPGEAIDLSSQYIVRGDTTTYVWKYNDNTIVDPTLYTEDKGVFTFNSDLDSAVYCEMTIPAYPKLTGEKAYVTTPIMVKNVETIMTMTAEPGKALDFELMCATAGQTLYIDWGDGKRVQYDNIANAIDDWWGTEVGNTVLGEGNIAIYGDAAQFCYFSSIWSAARTEGEEDGSKILSVDVSKATELTDLTLQSHALTTIDVSNLTKLTSLIVMCNLTEIDLSKNPEITTLTLSENDLQSLDLSHLSKLKTLRLNENRGLTNETLKFPTETGVLTSVYALGLGLTGKVDFSMYPKITTLSLNDNPGITGIDARGKVLTSLTCLDCSSLTEILVDSVRTTFNVRNTAMTPATLPYFTIFNFAYDPLLAYEIPAEVKAGESIDLSSQYIVRGDTSIYTWKYTDGSEVDASYYTENKGVFSFKEAPKDTVYCEITVPAYPKLTGEKAYVTTKTVIIPGASAIDAAEEQAMTVYTSKGCIVVENVSVTVTLYSGITGQVVAEKSGETKVVFDGLQPGLYIVKCDNKAVKAIVR